MAVFGEPIFEFTDPLCERGDHLLVLIELGAEALDEFYYRFRTLSINS